MRKVLIISMMVLCYHHAFSQKENFVWVFGDSIGLDFNNSPPSVITSSMRSFEACASISDSSGNLLFYTNGLNVWNRDDELMPNGTDLEIGLFLPDYGSSITQGVTIVPKPLTNLYFIIYKANVGIKYSIIDMDQDSGKGEVIEKNIVLDTSMYFYTEKMQVIKHGNGRDYWLVLYAGDDYLILGDTMMFVSYLITPEGIEGPVLVQDASPYTPAGTVGQMKFSLDGSILINTRKEDLDIYDFNRCSGIVSNKRILENAIPNTNVLYSCEISADASKIYMGYNNYPLIKKPLLQYCLNCEIEISETRDTIYYFTDKKEIICQMQIGSDEKIYITTSYYDSLSTHNYYNTHLSVINSPNELGELADLELFAIELPSGRSNFGLPNICDYSLGVLAGSECDTSGTAIYDEDNIKNAITFYPNPANEYIIISGDINAGTIIKIYSADGRVVLQEKINTTNTKVDISTLPPGVYVIQISEDGWVRYSEKLFK